MLQTVKNSAFGISVVQFVFES